MTYNIKPGSPQHYVIRAIYALRGGDYRIKLEHSDVEEKTSKLRHDDGARKTNPVGRQSWTSPFKPTDTDKVWEQIGDAVRGKLPHNHPIEMLIRDCKADDTVEKERYKEENERLLERLADLESRVAIAEVASKAAVAELQEFKNKHYARQCEDALYTVEFRKIVKQNESFIERAKQADKTIKALTAKVSSLEREKSDLESILADEDSALNSDVKSIKRPVIIEPKISGTNVTKDAAGLLEEYSKAIQAELDVLEDTAKKKDRPDITIVYHECNIDLKASIDAGRIPFRSSRLDNILFACVGPTPRDRQEIYLRASTLIPSAPRVVIVSGKGKVEQLPVKERTIESDHEWFTALVRTGKIKLRPVNGLEEGYDTVVYRRAGNGE